MDGADKKLLVLERKQDLDVTKMELLSPSTTFTLPPNFEARRAPKDNDDLLLYPFGGHPTPSSARTR